MYVSELGNRRVLVFNLDENNQLTSKTANNVIGQPDFFTNTAGTTQNKLNTTHGIAIDSTNQRLYVADSGNRRVLVFDTQNITNGMNAAYVIGQPDFTSNPSAVTQNGLAYPYDVDYDNTNNRLYVVD